MTVYLKATEIGAQGAMTLPGRCFTDADVLDDEFEAIFYRRWLCAGRGAELREPGDFIVRNIGTESVILLRDRVGEIRAFHNVCRHRGTRICEDMSGHFASNIRCPYHAWTYGLDGR